MSKPFAPSAERNQQAILEVLQRELTGSERVLEVGSGTGQHACFFGPALPGVVWQPSELANNIAGIRQWLSEHELNNVLDPVVLDVDVHPWPVTHADVCFTCNTLHIVNEESVHSIFAGARQVLRTGGKLCVYGPFTINGKHVSPSNQEFDQWLKASDSRSGVRDLTKLDELAQNLGFLPSRRTKMPANNLMLIWDTS